MIKRSLIIAGLAALCVSPAYADISSLTAKFGGGCTSTSKGSCIIKVTASGDTDGETIIIEHAATQKGPFKKISNEGHSISSGSVSVRFKNLDGCYLAVTGPNGNDKPDISSKKICEK